MLGISSGPLGKMATEKKILGKVHQPRCQASREEVGSDDFFKMPGDTGGTYIVAWNERNLCSKILV
jgi:hypothetical protein